MLPDCYQVEVLYFLNPHLIWVEVIDPSIAKKDEFVFEQIGLYSILPLLNVEDERSKTSSKWLPAVNETLHKAFSGAYKIWFTPTFIDRRTTIFDDNLHKYGEFMLKKSDGNKKYLSKILVKSGLAVYDMCLFHQELAFGNIKTKLSNSESQDVFKQIECHYSKKRVSKKQKRKSLKTQAQVPHSSQNAESVLTCVNLEKHNNAQILQAVENRVENVEICRNINEESMQEVFKLKNKKLCSNSNTIDIKSIDQKDNSIKLLCEPELKSSLLTKKLDFITAKNNIKAKNELNSNIEVILQASKTNLDINRKQQKSEGINEKSQLYNDISNSNSDVKDFVDKKMQGKVDKNFKSTSSPECEHASPKDMNSRITNTNHKSLKRNERKVGYAPPGVDLTKIKLKVICENEQVQPVSCVEEIAENCYFKEDFNGKSSSYDLNIGHTVNSYTNEDCSKRNRDIEKVSDIKIKEFIEPLSSGHSITNTHNEQSHDNYDSKKLEDMDNVKLFKNIDPGASRFVDKLVTPVLMVHSKKDLHIQHYSNLSDLPFSAHIHSVLKNMSVEKPMMLQTISWYYILHGYSMFMISPVGSGKTLGYLPAVCHVVSHTTPGDCKSVGPICIIVCATAKSVAIVEKLAKRFLGIQKKVLSCFVGVDEAHIITSLLNGCDLFICTPLLLTSLLQVTDFGLDLRRLTTVVLDDCERLTEVYINEIKFLQYKIKDMLKTRVNNKLLVNYIVASRKWCDCIGSIAKKAPLSIVCIGAFQECVLYSNANMSVNFVQKDKKFTILLEFLKEIDRTKAMVIVCKTDTEIEELANSLEKYKYTIFVCDNKMNVQDLYKLRIAWDDYEYSSLGPILLCCDDTLIHMNVTNAHYLVHYSLPDTFSNFCRRFSVLNDNYKSLFKLNTDNVKIKVLLDQSNLEQLPKIVNFIKRCMQNIPEHLNKICEEALAQRDLIKAMNMLPLCENLMSLGYCLDFSNCHERHTVFKDHDQSKEWIPKVGIITFKILHFHTAALYSARLLTNVVNNMPYKYPQTYGSLSLKMGMYYSKDYNKKLQGIPKIGDICAVSIKENYFARCQVVKILSKYQSGNPDRVLVKLIDEEKLERTRDIYLYHLPDELRSLETYVIQVRLANIQPKDKDITFSDLARDQLKNITDQDEDIYFRGHVVMAIGNCVFVETLEACQELGSLGGTVVKCNLKHDLLEKHALPNNEHTTKLKKLCEGKIVAQNDIVVVAVSKAVQSLPAGTWAYLDSDNMSTVFFASAINPEKFFVRLDKFESCINLLVKDIQKHIMENPEPLHEVNLDDIVLAMFPDDKTYERARIDAMLDENKYKCFFVDQGDWREVSANNLAPITEHFINRLPFQAIECRLVGVKPVGDEWTDFSTNWFCDKCYDDTDHLKHLYVKSFIKEKPDCTGGNKYGVAIIDTNGERDVIINRLLIDVNLACEKEYEMKYFEGLLSTKHCEIKRNNELLSEDEEKECELPRSVGPNPTSPLQTLFKQPLRSVPLVGSDSEDSNDLERWHINMSEDFMAMLKPVDTTTEKNLKPKFIMPALTHNETQNEYDSSEDKPCLNIKKRLASRKTVTELDSDDFSSPETSSKTSSYSNSPLRRPLKSLAVVNQMRKPKLVWGQNKNMITIKINLIGLEKYDLKIEERCISFAASLNDLDYSFDIELYGVIDVYKSSHSNKGQYVLVKLSKLIHKHWLTLTRDKRKWIVYDVDYVDTSSEEEVGTKDSLLNTLKYHEKSESEDDDFIDDINFN